MWTGERTTEESAARLARYVAALSRRRWLLLAWIALWTGLGGAYVAFVKPEFVARVDIMLEPRRVANDGPEDLRHYHQYALDSEQADTELRVLRSEELLHPIFVQLDLASVPELRDGHDGFWSEAAHVLHRLSPASSPYAAGDRAYFAFVDRVRSLRLGLSYVLEISYRSGDRTRAIRVANAIAASYLNDRLVRRQAEIERVGGPYLVARRDAVVTQIAETRAAMRDGFSAAEAGVYGGARVLGAAMAPLVKSYPKTVPTISLALGFATISGILLVLATAGRPAARRPSHEEVQAPSATRRAATLLPK